MAAAGSMAGFALIRAVAMRPRAVSVAGSDQGCGAIATPGNCRSSPGKSVAAGVKAASRASRPRTSTQARATTSQPTSAVRAKPDRLPAPRGSSGLAAPRRTPALRRAARLKVANFTRGPSPIPSLVRRIARESASQKSMTRGGFGAERGSRVQPCTPRRPWHARRLAPPGPDHMQARMLVPPTVIPAGKPSEQRIDNTASRDYLLTAPY